MNPFEQRGHAILEHLAGIERPRIAEIGVFCGALSGYLLAQNPNLHLFMVDSWAESDRQPDRYKATKDFHARQTREQADRYMAEAVARVRQFPGRSTMMVMTSLDAAQNMADASLDLVFLDADHSYEGVAEDIAAWAPKVKPGGWISGHDYCNTDPAFNFGVERAVDEWAAAGGHKIELGLNFTWFARV